MEKFFNFLVNYYILIIVILAILYFIFIFKSLVSKKQAKFYVFKDKENGIYIYFYQTKFNNNSKNSTANNNIYFGKAYINNSINNELKIYDASSSNIAGDLMLHNSYFDRISNFVNINMSDTAFTYAIKYIRESYKDKKIYKLDVNLLNKDITKFIDYSLKLDDKIINGNFEILDTNNIHVNYHFLYNYKSNGNENYVYFIFFISYIFRDKIININNKNKINHDSKIDKKRLSRNIENYIKKYDSNIDYKELLYKINEFYNFDITYIDDNIICFYQRKISYKKNILSIKNKSLIYNLNDQNLISSSLLNLIEIEKTDELLKSLYKKNIKLKYNLEDLNFLINDCCIIIFEESSSNLLYIPIEYMKDYIDVNSEIYYIFN